MYYALWFPAERANLNWAEIKCEIYQVLCFKKENADISAGVNVAFFRTSVGLIMILLTKE